jgi:hypothetical protein
VKRDRGMPRVAARLLAVLVGAFAACVAVEAFARVHSLFASGPRGTAGGMARLAAATRVALAGADDAGPDRTARPEDAAILHPYLGAETVEATIAFPSVARESRADADVLEVVVVGSAFGRDLVRDCGERVAAALGHDGRTVRVRALGDVPKKQPQQILALHLALAHGMRIDVLVNVDGSDDCIVARRNAGRGYSPLYPDADLWSVLAHGRPSSDEERRALVAIDERRARLLRLEALATTGLVRSAFLRTMLIARAEHHARAVILARRHLAEISARADETATGLAGPAAEGDDPDAVIDAAIRAWVEGSLSLAAVCAQRGIRYVHLLEPAAHDDAPGSPAADRARLRAASARLRDAGIRLLDAEEILGPKSDRARLLELTGALLAERLAATLEAPKH